MKGEIDKITRRALLSSTAFAAGAYALGCGGRGPKRNPEMTYRKLGNTGLEVSEIGFGAEWMVRHDQAECTALARRCEQYGINIVDCWMGDPVVRTKLGNALAGHRGDWIIQGHVCSNWNDGKFEITRDVAKCRASFADLLKRLQTDYVDIGMIFLVDKLAEWEDISKGPLMDYMRELKASGRIRHIGLSTHNPQVGFAVAQSGLVEMMLFCINPAYDLLPPMENHMNLFNDETFDAKLGGIAPERAELYRLCAAKGIGLTVMKTYAGGRLLDAARSPFKVALTPVQCIHYALTRPAVASVLIGYDTPEHVDAAAHYEKSTAAERDYATVLAKAPRHRFDGECTYCDHCAPCSVGIPIGTVNKLYDLAVSQPAIPDSVREHYASLRHHADECTGCGACERRCPFHVKVIERMRLAAKLFGSVVAGVLVALEADAGWEQSLDGVLDVPVTVSCAEPGAWRIAAAATASGEAGVAVVDVTLTAEKAARPPEFTVGWKMPERDMPYYWHVSTWLGSHPASWGWRTEKSWLCSRSPIYAYYSAR